jgi:ubiquinone/menaquinone biosynthesis C-methylase UbiE
LNNPYVPASRWSRISAWVIAGLFLLGFFYHPLGTWTGPILGVWFILSQKPVRGFLWMIVFSFLFGIPAIVHTLWLIIWKHDLPNTPEFLLTVLATFLMGALPLTVHRLVSPRLPGFASTLPFPLAAVLFRLTLPLALQSIPAGQVDISLFFTSWFASVVVWMWHRQASPQKTPAMAWIPSAFFLGVSACALLVSFTQPILPIAAFGVVSGPNFLWICLGGLLLLSFWATLRSPKQSPWANRHEAVAKLQSPFTGRPLHVVKEHGRETLVSDSGEHFPIRHGVPSFLAPDDLTGNNGKYNHVYETIGGFYGDIQRVFAALKGFDLDAYFRSYMGRLEVKPGDSVLETSVGTGLNYKYLPPGTKLAGLDLSPEMLANCQVNLRRWHLDADLYLGNAECLPFADESFDVVYHVGGINFFNDRAKAIREMIRVAKPGSLLLIADETEKHVKEVYEKHSGSLWKNRKEPVKPPVDLIPPTMEEVHLEELRNGDTYTLTFRKPFAVRPVETEPIASCAT